MIKGIYLSSHSLAAKSKNIDSVANNLANINATGYKRQIPFSEVLMKSGKTEVRQYTDFKQGEIVATNNPLDLAIAGNGYFVLKTPDGSEYTRNGKFTIDKEGYIVNGQGYKVLGRSGEINVSAFKTQDAQDITIKNNGEIKIGGNTVDSLMIANINDSQNTIRASGLNFTADDTNVSIEPEDQYEVQQGYLEESNVNPIIEMESMIKTNTAYESAQKMMKYLDQSLGQANDIGRVV